MDTYTFSEAITLANMFLHDAFSCQCERFAAKASKWFIKAETARAEGTVRAESYWRENYLSK